MTIKGIDLSHHQDRTPSLAGLGFVFVRATYGGSPDGRYARHVAAARAAGLVVGAYHFGVGGAQASVTAQVDAFLATAKDADVLALDLERNVLRGGRIGPTMTRDEAKAFIAAVHARDPRKILLYHSRSGFPNLGQDGNWIAQWGGTPPKGIPWAFWQYRGSPLDLNLFNGDRATLLRLIGPDPTVRARLGEYIARLTAVARPSSAQRAKLVEYLGRLGRLVGAAPTPAPAPAPAPAPRPTPPATPVPPVRDVTVPYVPATTPLGAYWTFETTPVGWLSRAGGRIGSKGPSVVLVHGGPQSRGQSLGALAALLASRGANVLEVDYPNAPEDTPGWPATGQIIAAAIGWMRSHHGGPVVLVGHSLGGVFASVVAHGPGSFSDRPDRYVHLAGEVALNPGPYVNAFAGIPPVSAVARVIPETVVTASLDAQATPADLRGYAAALTTNGLRPATVLVDGADHTTVLQSTAAIAAVLGTA